MLAYLSLITFIFIPLCLVLYHICVFWCRKGRMVNKLPGPPCLPVIGNLHLLNVDLVRFSELLRDWSNQYYPVYRLWVGNQAVIQIRHPDDLEVMLTSSTQLNKDWGYEPFRPWLRTGLITSEVPKWHQRRKILTPAFHVNLLKKYLEITNEQGDFLIEDIKARGEETSEDLLSLYSKYTLNLICESVMGVALDDNADKESSSKYKSAVYHMGDIILTRVTRPYIRDWMMPFIPCWGRLFKTTLHNLETFINKIIEERRKYHQMTNYENLKIQFDECASDDSCIGVKKKRLAMLDHLLLAENQGLIDEDGIKEEVATFIFAGHDTSAMAIRFTIMLLAENRDAQNRARIEVEEILNKTGGKLEMSDLQQMSYLERCIKESFRLLPPGPLIARKLTEDLQFKDFVAPKGCNILMHIYNLHRDPHFWPEPEKFDPDRFLPERALGRHPFAYLPFSAGSRNCIGQKFAMMELKSSIARILYNFEFEPVDYTRDIVIKSDFVLRPNHPLRTKFITIKR